MGHRSEIMWIERKTDGLVGPARIGRVTYSKSGRSLSYGEQRFENLKRKGFKANYVDLATGDQYWISGATRMGRTPSTQRPPRSTTMSGGNIGRKFATSPR